MTEEQINERRLPINFMRWSGPWRVTTLSFLDDDDNLLEQTFWVRMYEEKSHCGTPGCCSWESPHVGPELSPPVVSMTADQLRRESRY